jgi:hypothetical protein
MIHITQGKRKVNTVVIGRKNGWKIPILSDPTDEIVEGGKESHAECFQILPGKILPIIIHLYAFRWN